MGPSSSASLPEAPSMTHTHQEAAFSRADLGCAETQTAGGRTAKGLSPSCTRTHPSSSRALCLGRPRHLPHPGRARASPVGLGRGSGLNCRSSLLSGGGRLRRQERQLSRGVGRGAAGSSGGLSPHPAEPRREENVEAEPKVSEAVESKQAPEGRGGRDRPVRGEASSRQRDTEAAEEADPWLAGSSGTGRLCLLQKPWRVPSRPLLSKSLASGQLPRARASPRLTRACPGRAAGSGPLLPTQEQTSDPSGAGSSRLVVGEGQPGGDLPEVTELAAAASALEQRARLAGRGPGPLPATPALRPAFGPGL